MFTGMFAAELLEKQMILSLPVYAFAILIAFSSASLLLTYRIFPLIVKEKGAIPAFAVIVPLLVSYLFHGITRTQSPANTIVSVHKIIVYRAQ